VRIIQLDIREARPEDYLPIFELIKNELGYPQVDYDKLCTRLENIRSDARHLTAIAEADGQVAGFIGIYVGIAYNYDREFIQISALAVRKELQNRGIGSRLLQWAEEYAAKNDYQILKLTSRLHRVEAHAFYDRNGYEKKSYGFSKEISE